MDRGIDGRAGAAGEEEGPVQKTESGKFKLTHYPIVQSPALFLLSLPRTYRREIQRHQDAPKR